MKKTRIGMIGAGAMARAHLAALKDDDRAELVALSSRTAATAGVLADAFGMEYHDDWKQLLNLDLDALYVLTPDFLHREMAVAALENGLHLFLEKSLELDLNAGREIVRAGEKAAQNGIQTLMAYPLRFDPHYQKMHELLSSEGAGRGLYASSLRAHFLTTGTQMYDKYRDENYDPPEWYFKAENFGPMYSHASHDYDYMRWFLNDEVSRVYTVARRGLLPEGSANDAFVTTLEFGGGAIATVSTPWITRVEYDLITVASEKLTVMNRNNNVVWKSEDNEEHSEKYEFDLWQSINSHFLDVARGQAQPACTLQDGLAAATTATAVVRSAREERPVEISEIANA
jgi:predicted dehydrogenase